MYAQYSSTDNTEIVGPTEIDNQATDLTTPSVICRDDDGIIVAYRDDLTDPRIKVKALSSTFVEEISFYASTAIPGEDVTNPKLASFNDGSYLLVWNQDSRAILGVHFDASHNMIGQEFQITAAYSDAYTKSEVAIASLEDGKVAVAWTADYQDGSGYGIFAQLLDEDGNLLGNELWPNSYAGTD